MALVEGSPSVILKSVAKLIQQKVPTETAPLLEQFSSLLYGNISSQDLAHRNESDMYGATLSLWNELNGHQDDSPVIKVFNPQVSKHGWKSSHSIIEIIIKDMPFLVDSVRIALNRLGLSPHLLLNAPINVVRDKDNVITHLSASSAKLIKTTAPQREIKKHPATRSFQAIRMYINSELEQIETVLAASLSVLAEEGRLVVISFHSLEDRMVKRFMRNKVKGNEPPAGVPIRDDQIERHFALVGKAIKPSKQEVERNIRSRSAVMRVMEKLG